MRPQSVTIREGTAADLARIVALLAHAELGAADVLVPGTRYWVAESSSGELIGAIGAEYGAGALLLRSMAVLRAARGRALGAALVEHVLAAARAAGYRVAYLFSTDAGPYWERRGFREVPVPELVAALPHAPQVCHYDQIGWLPTEVAWRRDLEP
jgi:N-acetylglutamate synthase-like GNAT family acetyltransferase